MTTDDKVKRVFMVGELEVTDYEDGSRVISDFADGIHSYDEFIHMDLGKLFDSVNEQFNRVEQFLRNE